MKRLFMSIVTLVAIAVAGASCLQLEQPVLIENLSGDEIVFGADAHIEAETKASSGTTETTSLTSFYVSAVTGSAGSESSAWTSTQFTKVTGSSPAVYKGSKMWPASNPSYKFYASNRPLTFAAAGTTVSATNTTDVVCAYLTNGTYKTKNTLTFEHIFARFGRVDVAAESGYTISNISIRITPKTGGTYNLRTGAGKTDGTGWSSVTSGSATVVANATGANANDIYLVPGTYEVKATWTATQSGTSITYTDKVVNVPIVGGKTNVVSIVLGGEILFGVDLEEYCEYNYRDNLNYLNFYCDEAGTIGWKCSDASIAKTIQYSKDQGATWTSITSTTDGVTVSVSAGDIVWFKGSNSSYATSSYDNRFTLTNKAHVYGNFNSLTGNNTSVGAYCFRDLFAGCGSNLYTYAEKKIILPATTLATGCYMYMFAGCTSLTTAPELPATTLAATCYSNMFYECTSLTTAPETLPATTLAQSCYNSMFVRCTSLTTAPELPATTLAGCCYYYMFSGCTSLMTAPELPATTLETECYYHMFAGCTSLTTAPELPATSLVSGCYSGMFSNCSSLNYIKAMFTTTPSKDYTQGWVAGVAATGTFIKNFAATWDVTGTKGVPTGWTVKADDPRDITDYLSFYCDEAGTIGWKGYSFTATIQYSKDFGATWTNITSTSSGATISVSAGDIVWFKGNNSSYCSSYGYYAYFTLSNKAHVYGNVNSLTGNNNSVSEYCFRYLFYSCSNLYTYKDKRITLPATSLSNYCYSNMFRGCTNMTDPPVLPATSMADYCYEYMFCNCTGLKSCPELPATSLAQYCYRYMFQYCSSLLLGPELPASSLVEGCYQYMFDHCSSLVAAPELPATTLAVYCYGWMFQYCSSLVKTPELPATTLTSSCYKSMFAHCSNLIVACELPATLAKQYCYSYMFYDCPKLLVAPKVLPADNLEYECYRQMFDGCSSLKTAPEILATTMSEQNCCFNMFYHCSSLNYIKALFLTTPSDVYTQSWVGGVAKTGTFVKNKDATWDVIGFNGVPTGWTVVPYVPPIGKFTDFNGRKIGFAPGNLQCTIESGPDATGYNYTGTDWCFAEHQWDYLGSSDGANSFTVGKKMDLFGWVGKSASYDTYGLCAYTYSGTSYYGGYSDDVLKTDWGNIPGVLSNCGQGWFTLSSNDWDYIFNTRTSGTVGSTSNARYTQATIRTDVSGVNGIILFPDDCSIDASEFTTLGTINGTSAWGTKCTAAQWEALEAKGCVFFPAAGYRESGSISRVGSYGFYWSSTAYKTNQAFDFYFYSGLCNPRNSYYRYPDYSVRLAVYLE